MAQYFSYPGDYEHAVAAGQRALTLAAASGNVGTRLSANLHMSGAYSNLGDYRRSMDGLRQNVTFLTGESACERFGIPGLPAAINRSFLAWNLTEVGAFAEAIVWGEEGGG